MAIFRPWYIIRNGIQFRCFFKYLFFGYVNKFRFTIHKIPDQPGAGYPVDLWPFTRDPFHKSLFMV